MGLDVERRCSEADLHRHDPDRGECSMNGYDLDRVRAAQESGLIRPGLQPARMEPEWRNSEERRELIKAMGIAKELDAKNYPGGWCQLMNYKNSGNYPFTHS